MAELRKKRWTNEDLLALVPTATCYADLIRGLGLSTTAAGNWKQLKNMLKF